MMTLLLLFALGAGPTPNGAGLDVLREPHWYRPAAQPVPRPKRVVSLAPVITETLYRVGAGELVVGVTRFCDRPPEAQQKKAVGGYSDASLEAILALHPDVVMAMPNLGQRQLLDRLRDRGIAVFVAFTDTLDEERAMIGGIAAVVGRDAAAAVVLAAQDQTLAAVAARGAGRGRRGVVVVGHDPLYVAGRGSFGDTAWRLTGAESAIADADPQWPQWSLEALLARRVDIVVVAEGAEAAAALRRQLAPLGARAPDVRAAPTSILMRPGPSFAADVLALEALLAPAKGPPPP
jgi:iron complex transport system substrate-binding protein